MTKEELIKDQFPNDEFLQSAVLQIVNKCTADLEQDLEHKKIAIRSRNAKIKKLEAQIEKMKNRCNCKNGWYSTIGRAGFGCNLNIIKCAGCKHWEMKE